MSNPNVSGPEFKYLGHYRNPKILAAGHNTLHEEKEEEERILREAEESIRRLEEAGFGKSKPEQEKPKPVPAPSPTMEEQIKARKKALKQLGVF
ncbi:MAG: hypothetical protein ACREBU_11445 [Nitrososphaera sp.]